MSRNTKIILLVAGGVLLILIIILVVIFVNRGSTGSLDDSADLASGAGGSLPVNSSLIINSNVETIITADNAPTLNEEQKREVNLEQIARMFAERFGSYSNQSNFENIKDLQVFMTDYMKKWSEEYIAEHSTGASPIYWGVTTNALSIKSSDIDDSEATVVVATRRRETSADHDNYKVYNQDLKVLFKRVGGVWLVDGAYWQ